MAERRSGRFAGAALAGAVTVAVLAAGAPPASGRDPDPGTDAAPPTTANALTVETSFVSAVGWVKPGQTYPFRVFVRNSSPEPASDVRVRVAAVDGASYVSARPVRAWGRARIRNGHITWIIGRVPAGSRRNPAVATLVVTAQADTPAEDPRIVWKNLSSTSLLSYEISGRMDQARSTSHGPKVIPPAPTFDTARYGDRPFPVVPVDFADRKHNPDNDGKLVARTINSPKDPGSTFNLYQEMSYGQLYPHGTVPSAGIESAGFEVDWKSERFRESGFQFTTPEPQGSCRGVTQKDVAGTPAYPERIAGGWYQLPGTTDYYGDDRYGTALIGALGGVGSLQAIDDACGPTQKAVYDAAHIADPEIDYSDYDTNKDGVVDFFMMIFVGRGGHGVSQTSVPPYDNIWPHSSSLESAFIDPETGLSGYISDDHLEDLKGRKLYFTNETRAKMTTRKTDYPVYVRVGPYNVNPETSLTYASVISHEYGHSLGLPDFYSTGTRSTYGDWNLMASDKSQHMDVFSKQELGWLVPRVLKRGTRVIEDWQDSKNNTHRIDWVTKNGRPYTLRGPDVDNGEAYVARLPARHVIDPLKVKDSASPEHVWWSGSGRRFGCPPQQGHNLDVYLPELADVAPGTPVTVTFKSYWKIKWDDDYGFVMYTTDRGETYHSVPSERGYTTPVVRNPQEDQCQALYGNGLTGTSGSYQSSSQEIDRVAGNYPDGPFLEDGYDLSAAAGQETVLRFSYTTDPGSTRLGWFIDDLKVAAGDDVIYETKFETVTHGSPIYNGGCKDDLTTAQQCTPGWSYISSTQGSTTDHAYYMEMRDRSGFDMSGRAESERGGIGFLPGLLLVYTDEMHGYGNVGVDNPPPQSPLDSQPQPGNSNPNLNDAAWTAARGDNAFTDDGDGHVDNYTDPRRPAETGEEADTTWLFLFECLAFRVLSMAGEEIGPDPLPGDLTARVRVSIGEGCGRFDYGWGGPPPRAGA